MVVKRAVLVGCNYPGSDCPLNGCVNDVRTVKTLLTSRWGFQDKEIHVLIDTDSGFMQPTGKNIKQALNSMVATASRGDVLFFHYSGHGTQVPQIVDDDLRTIFGKVPKGVHLTVVTDCCHSGGLLDHSSVVISGDKETPSRGFLMKGVIKNVASKATGMFRGSGRGKGVGELLAGGLVEQKNVHNRSIPIDMVAKILSSRTGQSIGPGNLVSSLSSIFGSDAGGLVGKAAAAFLKAHGGATGGTAPSWLTSAATNILSGEGGSGGGASGVALAGIMGMMGGGSAAQPTTTEGGGTGGTLSSIMATMGGGGGGEGASPAMSAPPAGPSLQSLVNGKLNEDVGILVTGCQSNETSADACPSGDPALAFGALTNAIKSVVTAKKGAAPVTNRQLVVQVREYLKQGSFEQNPTLECSERNADIPFICTPVMA
eukprot:jgi/Mesvir1/20968/Mv08035-RA.1